MPVEASDIVPTAMDTGDFPCTGCEEEGLRSDDGVRKKTERTREPELSNQIHIANGEIQRKPWKSRPGRESSLQIQPDNGCEFSATEEAGSGKRETRPFMPFTFLMRVTIALCQTE
jgi:hypothetical protein